MQCCVITNVHELHWLKVKYRVFFKILLIVHNCLHNKAPNEVIALLPFSDSERTMNLRETRVMKSHYGDRAFSHVAPKLWNLLPKEIRGEDDTLQFKKLLKSYLLTRGEEYVLLTKRR